MKIVDRPVGIDLGTTNSEIALLDPSERELVVHADRFGRRTVPSALAWDASSGRFVVGRAARQKRGGKEAPVESIKRRMGQAVAVAVGPHALRPEEISAKILAELRERMLVDLRARTPEGLEPRVDRAVITVPAYFDGPQVAATREAGELAGLEVLAVLQEPTAAAMYHAWRGEIGDGVFLVYDLGGGTFDVSILRTSLGEQQVLAIDGDNYLGGDDLDRRFAERLRAMLVERGYALAKDDPARTQRLVHLAQEIKETLSTEEVAHVAREAIFEDDVGEPVSVDLEIGRRDWEAAVADLVEQTITCCERALARAEEVAGTKPSDIDRVILVGGSTRTPLVIRRVREAIASRTKSAELAQAEVDTCVALGAAIHAAQLGGFRIADEKARVSFVSPLVTRTSEIKLALRVESPPDVRRVVVLGERGELAAAAAEAGADKPLRLVVPIGETEETALSLALEGEGGVEITRLPFAVFRGELRARASALSQPTVVAKDVGLEVVRAGRRERKVLIPRGASLPTEVTTELATADRSGAVVLRILSNRLPVETLVLEVGPDVAVGTKVKLTLSCDAAMRLDARAEVAGRELWAKIEMAKRDETSAREIDALLEEVEKVERRLWGRDADGFRRAVGPLVQGLREGRTTAPEKRAALAMQLRVAIDEVASQGDRLSPPLARFEDTLDALRRIVFVSDTALLGKPIEHWEARIGDLDARGRSAWEAQDEPGWRRATNEAQALFETASTQASVARRSDDPGYLALRATGTRAWGDRLLRALDDFALSDAPEIRALQTKEREALASAVRAALVKMLADSEGKEPHEIRRALDQAAADLDRVERAVERLPAIGLVTDR
ncbi:MAG: Hsp70 family protein [Sandaracinus sp.]